MKYMHRQSGGIDRRTFLKMAVGSGFALAAFPGAAQAPSAPAELKPHQRPSAFVSIADDGTVTVTIGKIDIGQGVHTALPMLVAEEMDADWNKVKLEWAPADPRFYGYTFNNVQMMQIVGSRAVQLYYAQLRVAGAQVRKVLILSLIHISEPTRPY